MRRGTASIGHAITCALLVGGLLASGCSSGNSSVTINPGPDPGTPRITLISPDSGTSAGGDTVLIITEEFQDDFTGAIPVVLFDSAQAIPVTALGPRTLEVVVPADPNPIPSGLRPVDVDLISASGLESATLVDGFTYVTDSDPCIEVVPSSGAVSGGELITITSLGLCTWTTQVLLVPTFDGIPAASVVFVDSRTIQCVTPPGPRVGPVDVAVEGLDPLGNPCTCVLPDGFTYR